MDHEPFTCQEWTTCIKVLQTLSRHPSLGADDQTLKTLVPNFYKMTRKQNRVTSSVRELRKQKTTLENADQARQGI